MKIPGGGILRKVLEFRAAGSETTATIRRPKLRELEPETEMDQAFLSLALAEISVPETPEDQHSTIFDDLRHNAICWISLRRTCAHTGI